MHINVHVYILGKIHAQCTCTLNFFVFYRESRCSFIYTMMAVCSPMSSAGTVCACNTSTCTCTCVYVQCHITLLFMRMHVQHPSNIILLISLSLLSFSLSLSPHSQLLCSESVVNYLSRNFISWAWDLTFHEHRIK